MGIYACPRCGNPNGWWSGNMRDVHDCPGPPRRQWPGQPPEFDWAELDEQPTNGVVVDRALNTTPVANQKPANLIDNADGVGTLARCAHHPSKCPQWEDCRARQECVGAPGVQACTFPDCSCPPDGQGEVHCPHGVQGTFHCRKPAIGPTCDMQCDRCAADGVLASSTEQKGGA